MITKSIDGVSFELNEEFDFAFLAEYGKIFSVFDQQDSGYICFGVQTDSKKLFLKVAGAATVRSSTSPAAAIARLTSTVSIHQDLRHPALIDLIESKEIGGGYLTVYEWFDGDCMGRQYNSHDKFIALPFKQKLDIFNEIVLFHSHTNKCGYIALDFYDGSIMYDFVSEKTRICDIELYCKKPVINTMGRMWGSSRFMSPEEFELGAEIDERSNVFLMGATAFQLFGGGMERNIEMWEASEALYIIALKAVRTAKEDRYQTIDEFFEAWNKAVSV
ncbi:serine/threonine-protein kinase [Paenibacillus albus]|uniref:Serine/threonine protein kinase n=1 Tax=Paenibacillus albus TaxID=2495582 RepID=A0A3Q8X4F4_9BACL|nr:serine/threonine protein kinase [Paenibacillus albus]AZN39004.1 serine/threonine protein kinase [Paenibacillus albus]